MKELDTWDAMQMAFEYYKKDSITVGEFNQWCDKYGEKHPDTYTHICRNDIAHEHECRRIWWEIRNDKPDLLHKQENVQCTTCGTRHYKYPNVEYFEKLIEMLSHLKKLEDLWSSK
jgi:hypothetical protein